MISTSIGISRRQSNFILHEASYFCETIKDNNLSGSIGLTRRAFEEGSTRTLCQVETADRTISLAVRLWFAWEGVDIDRITDNEVSGEVEHNGREDNPRAISTSAAVYE